MATTVSGLSNQLYWNTLDNLPPDSDYNEQNFIRVDGGNAMQADLDIGNHLVRNVSNPIMPSDATTRLYVDTAVTSVTAPTGIYYSDYMFWNNTSKAWAVGQSEIHIGSYAGYNGQGSYAVAIGYQSGMTNQGTNAIAIGYQAGQNNQHANSIVINASASVLNSATVNACYVNPIRGPTGSSNVLYYNSTTKEVTYGASPTGASVNLASVLANGNVAGATGIDMNSNKIINVLPGATGTDVANYSQLVPVKPGITGTFYNLNATTVTIGPYGDITQWIRPTSLVATGGQSTNIFTDRLGTTWKCHIFTNAGSIVEQFKVSNLGTYGTVDILLLGGGGSGGSNGNSSSASVGGSASGELVIIENLFLPSGNSNYPVYVGLGGASATSANGNNGENSSFTTLVSGYVYIAGGGQGGQRATLNTLPGGNLPSGIANSACSAGTGSVNSAMSIAYVPVSNTGMSSIILAGTAGGTRPIYTNAYTFSASGASFVNQSTAYAGGGGGGIGQNGGIGTAIMGSVGIGGAGGQGLLINFDGTSRYLGGGGGGTCFSSAGGSVTVGASATLYGAGASSLTVAGSAGSPNTGAGGGSSQTFYASGAGGSGLVIVRYRIY